MVQPSGSEKNFFLLLYFQSQAKSLTIVTISEPLFSVYRAESIQVDLKEKNTGN